MCSGFSSRRLCPNSQTCAGTNESTMSGFAWRAAFALTRATLFQALREANGRAGEVEFGAQLVFEEALIAEVQRLELISEKHKRGRRGSGLRDVKNLHL